MSNSNFVSPLVIFAEGRRPKAEIAAGDLVTWLDFANREFGARVVEILSDGTFLLKVVGLGDVSPYSIGMVLPISPEKVIDW